MQKDYRDGLEVVKFDLIEETAGSWLRAIIRRLEEDGYSKGSTKAAGPKPRNTEKRLYQKHHPKSAKPVKHCRREGWILQLLSECLARGFRVSPISGEPHRSLLSSIWMQ